MITLDSNTKSFLLPSGCLYLEIDNSINIDNNLDILLYQNNYYVIVNKVRYDHCIGLILKDLNSYENSSNDPKEPIYVETYCVCPSCKSEITNYSELCKYCGQKIKWNNLF